VRLLWSLIGPGPTRGLVLAREAGLAFTWDTGRTLGRIGPSGVYDLSPSLPAAPITLAVSEDAQVVAAGGPAGAKGGTVWLLGGNLLLRGEHSLDARVVSLALDPFGQHLAAATADGGLSLFVLPHFRTEWKTLTPRPLHHLAFVPEQPILVGAADHGLVCAFDRQGKQLWRDGLVAHVGSLSVSGDGHIVALACFSEGLICYHASRGRLERSPWPSPCRLGALSYSGDVVVAADLQGMVTARNREDHILGDWQPPSAIVALALGAMGEQALAAMADGQVACLQVGKG
jgi:hypothetical protein